MMMNRSFTLDEELIRRLVLRRDRDEREHERNRHGHVWPRFGRGLVDYAYESPPAASRERSA